MTMELFNEYTQGNFSKTKKLNKWEDNQTIDDFLKSNDFCVSPAECFGDDFVGINIYTNKEHEDEFLACVWIASTHEVIYIKGVLNMILFIKDFAPIVELKIISEKIGEIERMIESMQND